MEASCGTLFAGEDVETDCLTFVEEIPRKEVEQIEVSMVELIQPYSNRLLINM